MDDDGSNKTGIGLSHSKTVPRLKPIRESNVESALAETTATPCNRADTLAPS